MADSVEQLLEDLANDSTVMAGGDVRRRARVLLLDKDFVDKGEILAWFNGVRQDEIDQSDTRALEILDALQGMFQDTFDYWPEALEDFRTISDPHLGPFQKHSKTSRKAALSNYPRSGTQRERILVLLSKKMFGATREEVAIELDMSDNSVRPRIVELMAGGWVEVAKDATRLTKLGEDAEVLMPTKKAFKVMEDDQNDV